MYWNKNLVANTQYSQNCSDWRRDDQQSYWKNPVFWIRNCISVFYFTSEINIHFSIFTFYICKSRALQKVSHISNECAVFQITSHYLYITTKNLGIQKENELQNGYKFCLRLPKTGYRLKSLLLVLLFSYSAELIGLSSWN